MSDLSTIEILLREAGFDVGMLDVPPANVLTFEDDFVLGFVLFYSNPGALLMNWRDDNDKVLKAAQFALRRSGRKAWNAYVVFLASAPPSYSESIALAEIESDLVGTRKIARAGVSDSESLRGAFLPLLNVQNAPFLDPVDMVVEIRLRTTELPQVVVEAFLSDGSDADILSLLEDVQ